MTAPMLVESVSTELASCPFCGAAAVTDQSFCSACGQPGTRLAVETTFHRTYRILEVLATSSTGAVYRAQDARRKREVVIKELLLPVGSTAPERAALQKLFLQDARSFAHLKHPCLVGILHSFTQDSRLYLVMPLLPGQDLEKTIDARQEGYTEAQVRGWALQLLDLFEYLQGRHPPLAHGEILPAHLMLRPDGTVCVINYGLAWRLGLRPRIVPPGAAAAEPPLLPTKAGRSAKGEPHAGQEQPRLRDDLYGLGITMHAMLTGCEVFAGLQDPGQAFPSVRALAPRVSMGTAEAVARAVSPDASRRTTSILAMRTSLQLGTHMAIRVVPPRRQGSRAAALTVLLLALGAVIVLVLNAERTSAPTGLAAPDEANPLVATVPLPVSVHTVPIADTFLTANTEWPSNGTLAYRQHGELWLSNTTLSPLKVTRTSYATGSDGFKLQATIRLAQGPPDGLYGVVAADRIGTGWDNVALVLRSNGQWALLRYGEGRAPALVSWHTSAAVRLGHNTPNELGLLLTPGRAGHLGTFSVTINGVRLATNVSAWSNVPRGRVGLLAGPGTQIVASTLSVSPLGGPSPVAEDHFLDNRLDWSLVPASGSTSAVQARLLRLPPPAGQPWRLATARALDSAIWSFGMVAETTISLGTAPGSVGRQSTAVPQGGLTFARSISRGGNMTTLAAVLDLRGRVSLVSLSAGQVRTMQGPVPSTFARLGHGLNTIRVRVVVGAKGKLSATVSLNGGTVLTYMGPGTGVAPAIGFAATSPNTTLSASVLRLWGRGLHLKAT